MSVVIPETCPFCNGRPSSDAIPSVPGHPPFYRISCCSISGGIHKKYEDAVIGWDEATNRFRKIGNGEKTNG